MSFIEFLIIALATHRATALWISDELCRPWREGLTNYFLNWHRLTYLLNCPFCVSVWAGLVSSAVWMFAPEVAKIPVLGLAASMGVMFLDKIWKRLS